MVDDDPIDDLRGVSMTLGTSLSRAGEVLLRAAAQAKARRAETTSQETQIVAQRREAHAALAERQFTQARQPERLDKVSPRESAYTWGAARAWAEVDPQRFSEHANALTANFKDRYDVDLEEIAHQTGSADLAMAAAEVHVYRDRELAERHAEEQVRVAESQRLEREATALEQQARNDSLPEHEREELTNLAAEARLQSEELLSQKSPTQDPKVAEVPATVATPQSRVPDREAVPAYDSPERRARTEQQMRDAGVPEPARRARITADQMNAKNPREAAAAPTKSKKPAARSMSPGRTRDLGRSR